MKNLEFLAVAIVGQAAKDYETAYQKKDQKALRELEDWFSGEGFESLGLESDGARVLSDIQDRLESNGGKLR